MLGRNRNEGKDEGAQQGPPAAKYQMREKMLSVGDDSWIEDESGRKMFKANGKAMHVRDTIALEDASGNELLKIQEKKLHVRKTMEIERNGATVAEVQKRKLGLRDHYLIQLTDGPELKAHGNIVDHEYEVEGDPGKVAEISKKWLRVRDTYGISIAEGWDHPLVLAIMVCVDHMSHLVDD